jgi:hypothetical protein
VATLVAEVAGLYEQAGQREAVRVYFNGGTVPGERDRVYMEWLAPTIESPYRGDNERPDTGDLGARIRELTHESWIEFYEMLTPDKAVSG